ncbi:MAG: 2-C-methyl-D-erythritol 2,4-cyclodiphosphate synthase [Bacillota bacterium]|nr:2-C-methyl-D-erythritol 2,4-cyclodiphosphate synthase [Bacillota bacterium]
MRIGFGYDSHRLVKGRSLILGGVLIPYELGLLGHSDADVLTHAVIDALLGAQGAGDIGNLFPDSDPKYKDISSLLLLKTVIEQMKDYKITNIDCVVLAQEPKLSPYMNAIKSSLSECMGIDSSQINIKAKTEEGLGEVGRKEMVKAYAVALIE